MEKRHAMATFGLVEIGGGGQDGHSLRDQFVQDAPEIAPRDGIDARGRLVEKDHFGAMNERADQPELLLHAA